MPGSAFLLNSLYIYMYFVITIDTEEDNWGDFTSHDYSVENIEKIVTLQEIFDEFKVKPTYLITYPVATNEKSISILKDILDSGRCEIGTHCHPWNTPPYEETRSDYNSMLCNLHPDLQYRKIRTLHEAIIKNFGITPVSFKAGRWGFDRSVVRNIMKLGYMVDSSIAAFTSWTEYHGPDFSDMPPLPYRFSADTDIAPDTAHNGQIIIVPATRGFLQKNHFRSNYIFNFISNSFLGKLKIIGLLDKLNLLNKVWLSPELSPLDQMIKLTKAMEYNSYRFVNLTFHSTVLMNGLTPIVRSKEDKEEFMKRLRGYLLFAHRNGFKPITLSDTIDLV